MSKKNLPFNVCPGFVRSSMGIFILWCLLIGSTLAFRPLMPIDETRYVGVAWEMWTRHDFLVPYLNGEPYSHKPPLLFWLIHLSWVIFGVNEYSARLIPPLFALASLYLSSSVAKKLWLASRCAYEITPIILMGFFFWQVYSSLTVFDMLLAFFVLLGIYYVLELSQALTYKNTFLLGAVISGGLLSKGPVVFIHIIPAALLAPWWLTNQEKTFTWNNWYSKLCLAVLSGIALTLIWAIPASLQGGVVYQNEIFWGQISGRIIDSFAHKAPWWWYVTILPLAFMPWIFVVPFWYPFKPLSLHDSGVRFCIAWILPSFLTLSLISGKRFHYLLPLMPAIAMLLARKISIDHASLAEWQKKSLFVLVPLALCVLGLPIYLMLNHAFQWVKNLTIGNIFFIGYPFILLVFYLHIYKLFHTQNIKQLFFVLCSIVVIVPTFTAASYFETNSQRYDTKRIAQIITQLRSTEKEVAFYTSKYHNQFQFTGRIKTPITLIDNSPALQSWVVAHPDGFIIIKYKNLPQEMLFFSTPYRSQQLGILATQTLQLQPQLLSKLMP
jgi:4-amino-4-deoxy-L-arabinose transferase-like glycosyltransferase